MQKYLEVALYMKSAHTQEYRVRRNQRIEDKKWQRTDKYRGLLSHNIPSVF